MLNLVGDQYADLAASDVTVHPGYRRHGLGTRLLRELALTAADRKCLLIEGLVEGSAGQTRWQPRETASYRLAEWTGGVPDELLSSYAETRNAIREAPHGDMSFTEPEWTPQRVRDEEATAQARNCELRAVAAIHEPTGQVAGFTYLEVYPARPDLAVQQDTAVRPAHRGHGLGTWMKAANLRRLATDHPQVRRVTPSNAADNERMLRVNLQVGFLPEAATEIREAELTVLAERLGLDR